VPRKSAGARAPNGRSSIYLGADGKWHGYVSMGVRSDGTPDRRHRTGNSETEVTKKVQELEKKRDAGKPGKPGKVPTVREWISYWLTTVLPLAGRAPRTIDDYWSKSRTWIFPNIGRHRLDRCYSEHLEGLYARMAAAGKAPSHILKVHAIISSSYNAAIKRGKVTNNPADMVDPPELDEVEKDSLTEDEARAVLHAAQRKPNAARWSVGLSCGVRQGEALGLRWTHVVGRCQECGHVGALTMCWAQPKSTRCPRCGGACRAEARIWYQLQRLKWKHGCEDVAACSEGKHRRPCPKL
jgi:integrase